MTKRTTRSAARRAALGAAAASALVAAAAPAHAADHAAAPALTLRLFAAAPAGYSNPDDITRLGSLIFVTYQNNAGPTGAPAGSTSDIVAFDRHSGEIKQRYTIPGRVDGLTADTRHSRVIATVNEDLNSTLYVITPWAGQAVKHYTYSPDPAQTGSDGTNGGTDSVSISSDGTIYVAHSNPDVSLPAPNDAAAVYTVELTGSTAKLTPLFGVNDTAAVINPAPGAPAWAPLGLTDPDSNRWIRGHDGGTLIQDSQADSKLVFASDLDDKTPTLKQLNLTNATAPSGGAATPQLDDIVQAGGEGTLFVVDQKSGDIYQADTDGVAEGTLFVSQPAPGSGDLPNDPALGVVDPTTGVVTHLWVGVTLQSPKGLLFVSGSDD
ncbi:MAG TPA: hypothetical protein VGZ32_11330 [Actinocrinis sp.]|uniref:hypothetical protein n=1 Tax=Actinocrinis sp. TaxID=1920516 RepID=UPI002DDCEBC5|nr:hypothetical protein [Actinocrinis sp.]HEV3170927.1 hypothetical protein [Actinocrinis sp.]